MEDPLRLKISAQKQILANLEQQVAECEKRLAWLTIQVESAETTLRSCKIQLPSTALTPGSPHFQTRDDLAI